MPSGLAKVLLFAKAAPVLAKKGHCRISLSELENIGLGLQEVVLPSCVEKLMVKQSPTSIHLRHAKTFLCDFFSVQRQMALARSFNKPEIQLHFANSAN